MKQVDVTFRLGVLAILTMVSSVWETKAGLSLAIDDFTADTLRVSVSGVFDSDVAGDQKDWLAIKGDYSLNDGVNVSWIEDSIGNISLASSSLSVVENTISFSGLSVIDTFVAASFEPWGDSIYFLTSGAILAGTTVNGSLEVMGAGAFYPWQISSLELASGFDNADFSWNRLETATIIPEPATLSLLSLGSLALVMGRHRSKFAHQ